jgi:hypothetical protein
MRIQLIQISHLFNGVSSLAGDFDSIVAAKEHAQVVVDSSSIGYAILWNDDGYIPIGFTYSKEDLISRGNALPYMFMIIQGGAS